MERFCYKVAGASEAASYTFALAATVSGAVGDIVAFSGVDALTPLDVAAASLPAFTYANAVTAVTATTITTVTPNAAVLMFGQGVTTSAGTGGTWSGWSAGLTELYDHQGSGTANSATSVGAAWKTMATAGATGGGAATLSAAMRTGGLWVALRPATSTVASASNSTVSASPASVLADGTTTSTIVVTLKDSGGAAVPGKTVTLASNRGPTDTISAASGPSDAAGVVTFTVKSSTPGASVFTATDTTDSVVITQTAGVTFIVVASAANSTVSASPTSILADGAMTSTITVTLKDSGGAAVPGKTVMLASSRGATDTISVASGLSDASGVVTFAVKSTTPGGGVFTATDTTDSIVVTQTASVTFTSVSATNSTVTASPTSVPADGVNTSTITVTLKDSSGAVVPGKTVTLASSRGATDTISAASGPSNASGVVTFTVKSTTAGTPVFTATDATDSMAVTQTAAVTFAAGAVSTGTSTVAASPISVPSDGVSASAITVTLKDANSNPVAGKTVTLASSRGAIDTISAASGLSDASGVVTFTVKSMTLGASVLTGTDTTDGVTLTQTATVTFAVGASAANSTVSASPISVLADGTSTSTITVTLKDSGGAAVDGKTVTLASNRGAIDTISAASGLSDAAGVVTFTVKSTTTGAPVLTATDTTDGVTVTQTATVTFTVGPVNAGSSTVSASPTSVPANGVGTSTITVTLKDAHGNPVAGRTVTLASSRGAVDTISAASGLSNVSGAVTFTVKSSTMGASVYTATDTTDGVTVTQTAAVMYASVSAANSTVVASPASVPANGVGNSTITVTLKDGNSNPVAGKTVTLTSSRGSIDSISVASGVSSATGVVTFTVKSSTPGLPVFTAKDTTDNVVITQTASVTFTVLASAGNSTVAASPTLVTANGISTATITVTLKDMTGAALSGKTVTLASNRGATDTFSARIGAFRRGGRCFVYREIYDDGSAYFYCNGYHRQHRGDTNGHCDLWIGECWELDSHGLAELGRGE